MNCEHVRAAILEADLNRGMLPAEVGDHAASCSRCSGVAYEARALTFAVSQLDRPPLPLGFELRLKARLEDLRARRERRRFWGRLAAIPAAAVAAALMVVMLRGGGGRGPLVPPVRYAEIELIVDAREPVSAVSLSLLLPVGVEPFDTEEVPTRTSEAFPYEFHWVEDVSRGENRYHLPVSALEQGSYEVRAALVKDGERVEALLTLDVSGTGVGSDRCRHSDERPAIKPALLEAGFL